MALFVCKFMYTMLGFGHGGDSRGVPFDLGPVISLHVKSLGRSTHPGVGENGVEHFLGGFLNQVFYPCTFGGYLLNWQSRHLPSLLFKPPSFSNP
jgi:hypothetical protein